MGEIHRHWKGRAPKKLAPHQCSERPRAAAGRCGVEGGLIDVEFIARFLLLRHAHDNGDILATTPSIALQRLGDRGLLDKTSAETLISVARLYQGSTQLLRLAIDDAFCPRDAPRGLTDLLPLAGDAPDMARLEAPLVETQKAVRELFVAIVGE